MGIETVAAVVGIAGGLNSLLNAPKAPKARMMPYQEAYEQAGAQLNPLYDTRMKDVLNNVQKDLINRGFSGQQAGTELSTETAAENERQRTAALAGLSQSIQQGYNDQSYRNSALEYQSDLQRHNLINQGLSSTADWLSGRTWVSNKNKPTGENTGNSSTFGPDFSLPKLRYNY